MRTSKLLAIFVFLAICSLASAKLYWAPPQGQGLMTVGTGGDYATLALAAADISTTAPTGNCTFEIISSITETAPISFFQNTGAFSVLIKPAASNPGVVTITTPNNTGTPAEWLGNFIIGPHRTNAALKPKRFDNLTIDGSKDGLGNRDLTITTGGTGATDVIRIIGNSDNITIKNCTITGTSTSASSRYGVVCYGIAWDNVTPGVADEILSPDNLTIQNCAITSNGGAASQGIATSFSNNTGHPTMIAGAACNGHVYRNNTIAARTRGIFMNFTAGVTIENNVISVNQTGSGFSSWGIWQLNGNGAPVYNQVIRNNRIAQFQHAITGTGAYGINEIAVEGAPAAAPGVNISYYIYNNMVGAFNFTGVAPSNIQYKGIRVANNAPKYYIYNNSIYMPAFVNVTGETPANCLGIGTNASPSYLAIKNNIIFLAESGGTCIYKSGATGTLVCNNNDFYTSGNAAFIGALGATPTTYNSLAAWQATGNDTNYAVAITGGRVTVSAPKAEQGQTISVTR